MDIDELSIYRGKDFKVNESITIHIPTLDEICTHGEQRYYNMIYMITSVGADLKWQLADMGFDYTKVNDFELFSSMLIRNFTQEQTSIIFGDLDFSKFNIIINEENHEPCMIQDVEKIERKEKQYPKLIKMLMKVFHIKPKYTEIITTDKVVIDEYTYEVMIKFIRSVHGLKRNDQIPANEGTKQILIDDAREEYERNKNNEFHSSLLNLISTMTNSEGFKYNHNEVWSIKINVFMDSVKRISKIKNADLLLQSGYSGYGINLKEIDKKQLDWLGEL